MLDVPQAHVGALVSLGPVLASTPGQLSRALKFEKVASYVWGIPGLPLQRWPRRVELFQATPVNHASAHALSDQH